MTIPEAIENLGYVKQRAEREGNGATCNAAELGIEALKAQKVYRELGFLRQDQLLPGETEE